LRGTIVNIESKPIVGRISIKNLPTLTTDATGRFELDLPPGTYEVGADLPGRMMSELVVEPGRFTEFRMVTADGRIRLRAR